MIGKDIAIQVAKLDGYIQSYPDSLQHWDYPGKQRIHGHTDILFCDYLISKDKVLKVIEKTVLGEEMRNRFIDILADLVGATPFPIRPQTFACLIATAPQLCIALLVVHGRYDP